MWSWKQFLVWIVKSRIQPPFPPPKHQEDQKKICWSLFKRPFQSLEVFYHASQTSLFAIVIYVFLGMGQWINSSRYKHHFQKSIKGNLICSKTYEKWFFLRWKTKKYFFWINCFSLIIQYFMQCTEKEFTRIFFWLYLQILFPIISFLYHWLIFIWALTYLVQMYIWTIFNSVDRGKNREYIKIKPFTYHTWSV